MRASLFSLDRFHVTQRPHRYDALKKYIYQREKQQHDFGQSYQDVEANERTALVGAGDAHPTTDSIFVSLLDRELRKITLFYENQEKEMLEDLHELEELARIREEAGLEGDHYLDDGTDDDDDDDDSLSRSRGDMSQSRDGLPPPGRRRRVSSSASQRRPVNSQGQGELLH